MGYDFFSNIVLAKIITNFAITIMVEVIIMVGNLLQLFIFPIVWL